MNTKSAILAPQTRALLEQVCALTSGQGTDWLGRLLNKEVFMPLAQDWLNRAGIPQVEYQVLMRFSRSLEKTLFAYRGQELGRRLEALLSRWCSQGVDEVKVQRLAVHCWESLCRMAGKEPEPESVQEAEDGQEDGQEAAE
ncbi:MAG: hypothetical protein JSU73_14070 [candidate division WOR-3 bacterium]|nr:MAG: hypothetical protein JSU73_14070 [candidate division WOR-3 bacterium]